MSTTSHAASAWSSANAIPSSMSPRSNVNACRSTVNVSVSPSVNFPGFVVSFSSFAGAFATWTSFAAAGAESRPLNAGLCRSRTTTACSNAIPFSLSATYRASVSIACVVLASDGYVTITCGAPGGGVGARGYGAGAGGGGGGIAGSARASSSRSCASFIPGGGQIGTSGSFTAFPQPTRRSFPPTTTPSVSSIALAASACVMNATKPLRAFTYLNLHAPDRAEAFEPPEEDVLVEVQREIANVDVRRLLVVGRLRVRRALDRVFDPALALRLVSRLLLRHHLLHQRVDRPRFQPARARGRWQRDRFLRRDRFLLLLDASEARVHPGRDVRRDVRLSHAIVRRILPRPRPRALHPRAHEVHSRLLLVRFERFRELVEQTRRLLRVALPLQLLLLLVLLKRRLLTLHREPGLGFGRRHRGRRPPL
eukprot:30850-Pelagococcus_subviridis.AAC.39